MKLGVGCGHNARQFAVSKISQHWLVSSKEARLCNLPSCIANIWPDKISSLISWARPDQWGLVEWSNPRVDWRAQCTMGDSLTARSVSTTVHQQVTCVSSLSCSNLYNQPLDAISWYLKSKYIAQGIATCLLCAPHKNLTRQTLMMRWGSERSVRLVPVAAGSPQFWSGPRCATSSKLSSTLKTTRI